MAFRGVVDPRLLYALGPLTDLSHAEAWRRLAPVAGRLGVRRPSYPTVRRALLEQQLLEALRLARLEVRRDLIADLLSGRVPYRWLHAVIVGKPLYPPVHPTRSRPPPAGHDPGAR